MNRLRTTAGETLYEALRQPIRRFLEGLDAAPRSPDVASLWRLRMILTSERELHETSQDAVHDDLFVLERYVDLFERYGHLWSLITDERFSESWSTLQDTLDALRLVRRLSSIEVSALEEQLAELEKTYPYNVFFSIGAVVERFECSLCQRDIDSVECPHRRGNLYRGRMAVGIAWNVVNVDHIAMVDRPKDKRCVVQYEDGGEQFKLVRLLSMLLRDRKYVVSDFGRLHFSKRLKPNPDYRKVGRNDHCYCGSGVKFKRCCIGRSLVEGDHVDISPWPMAAEKAVA